MNVARGKAVASHSTSNASPSQNASFFEKKDRSCRRLAADQDAASCRVRMPRFCSSSHQLRVPVLLGPMKKTLCASEVVAASAAAMKDARAAVSAVLASVRSECPKSLLPDAYPHWFTHKTARFQLRAKLPVRAFGPGCVSGEDQDSVLRDLVLKRPMYGL